MRGFFEKRARLLAEACVFLLVLGLLVSVPSWVDAQAPPSVKVRISADGREREARVPEGTIRAAVNAAGLFMGPKDETIPAATTHVRDGARIEVIRVVEKRLKVSEPLPFKNVYKPSSSFRGDRKVVQAGKPGQVDRFYLVTLKNGVEISRKLTASRITKKPVDQVTVIPSAGDLPSRGYFTGRKVLLMQATGYDPSPRSCGKGATGRTALGLRAGYGVVAVDPSYIPLGTRLYIEGYGYAVAADTGGAIKGNRIDLGHDSYSAACRVGRKMVKVHILD